MIAGFIMLPFGADVARTMLKGMFNITDNGFAESPPVSLGALADTHSLSLQRGFNFFCLAYGDDPNESAIRRRPGCRRRVSPIAAARFCRRGSPSARPSRRMST